MTITAQFEATEGGLVLSNAILLYRGEGSLREGCGGSQRAATFASIHDVEQHDGQPTIAAGAPLSRAHLRQWAEALGRTEVPEILPANVLVAHRDLLAWWAPAKVRTSYFKLTKPPKDLRALAAQTVLPLPYPAHVFVATHGGLGVYALAVSERPTADTVVMHSPVLNVFINGRLCWGNVPRPKGLSTAAIPDFERAVFDSWSTHPNQGQEHSVTGRGGLVRLWDDLAARGATRFPVRRLKPFTPGRERGGPEFTVTLGELIRRSARL